MKSGILAAAAFAAALFAVAACETMSADDCASADWAALGYQDAANNGAERLTARAQACAAANITPDSSAYSRGFAEGMRQFCSPRNGFEFGARGGTLSGSCPSEIDDEFQAAYFDGQEVRRAEQAVEESRSRVRSAESRIADIDRQLREDHPGNVRLINERADLLRQLPGMRIEVTRREADARRVRFQLSRRWR